MVGAALVLSAAPALADDAEDAEETAGLDRDPEITFLAPTPAAGSVLTGLQTIVVKADADGFSPLKAFRLTITSDDASVPEFQHVVSPSGFDETKPQTIRFEWNTSELTPHNGTYKLVAYGRTCDFDDCTFDSAENTVTVAGLKVDNAPAVVQGVQATMQGATPVVSWTPSREPDVRQYAILRTLPGQQPQQVGVASGGASYSDPCADPMPCPPGTTMTYQVAAIRHSPANPAGVRSQPSAMASATTAPAPAGPAPAGPAAPVKVVLPPPMSDAYAPTLPYKVPEPAPVEPAPAAPPAPAPVVEAPVDNSPAVGVGIVSALEQPRVPKVRYVAGTLMLIVLAMLVARGGGLLLGAGPRERR